MQAAAVRLPAERLRVFVSGHRTAVQKGVLYIGHSNSAAKKILSLLTHSAMLTHMPGAKVLAKDENGQNECLLGELVGGETDAQ